MRRIHQKPQRVYGLLSAFTGVALVLAVSGVAMPPVSLVAAPLLLFGPPLVLIYGLYHVAPDNDPSRDEQVMRLTAVHAIGTLLVGNVTATQLAGILFGAAPAPGAPILSVVDRLVLAATSGVVMWVALSGLSYFADTVLPGYRAFIQRWHCRRCGYDLRGAASDRCPECGEPARCRRCGRSMTGQRDEVCIHCGTPRVADPYEETEE